MAHLGASHSKPTRLDLPLKWWTPRKGWGLLTQEVVNMGQMRQSFTREFKSEAVKLVTESGRPTALVARDLVSRPICCGAGSRKSLAIRSSLFRGKGRRKPHEEELARLKRELVRVTQEREFSKSVAAYFAKPSS